MEERWELEGICRSRSSGRLGSPWEWKGLLKEHVEEVKNKTQDDARRNSGREMLVKEEAPMKETKMEPPEMPQGRQAFLG